MTKIPPKFPVSFELFVFPTQQRKSESRQTSTFFGLAFTTQSKPGEGKQYVMQEMGEIPP